MADEETTAGLEEQDDVDALETPVEQTETKSTATESKPLDENTMDASSEGGISASPTATKPPSKGIKGKLARFNIYFLLFILILVIAVLIIIVAYFQGKSTSNTKVKTQSLTADTLKQLATSDASIGSVSQVLNIESSAIFAGKVLIRDGLEVATTLRVGGTSALNTLNVSGATQLQQVQVNKDLGVSGNAGVQGSVTVSKNLQVTGTGTFGGALSAPQITTTTFQLNSDLTLTHHIIAGGVTPGLSRGSLGNGGTASNSGSDTGGSVSINVGTGAAAGCFVTVNFAAKYNSTPHVLITPVGSQTGRLDYYVDRNSSGFSICDATAPPAGTYAFDYFVVN